LLLLGSQKEQLLQHLGALYTNLLPLKFQTLIL